jgi:hypothetical protein
VLGIDTQAAVGEGGQLPMSTECDPIKILTTDAQIAEWNTDGLPADQVRAITTRRTAPMNFTVT